MTNGANLIVEALSKAPTECATSPSRLNEIGHRLVVHAGAAGKIGHHPNDRFVAEGGTGQSDVDGVIVTSGTDLVRLGLQLLRAEPGMQLETVDTCFAVRGAFRRGTHIT